eukprot:97781_1
MQASYNSHLLIPTCGLIPYHRRTEPYVLGTIQMNLPTAIHYMLCIAIHHSQYYQILLLILTDMTIILYLYRVIHLILRASEEQNLMTLRASGAAYDDTLICKTESICYIECSTELFACFGAHFVANESHIDTFLLECASSSSCQDGSVDVTHVGTAAIICRDSLSCKRMIVNVNQTNTFYFECLTTDSCTDVAIRIANTSNAMIKCYGVQSCTGLKVWSDSNDIEIFMYSFSDDITIIVPSEFNQDRLHCNEENSYLTLGGAEQYNLDELLRQLFEVGLPCEDVEYQFHVADRVPCEIMYQYFSTSAIDQTLSFLI